MKEKLRNLIANRLLMISSFAATVAIGAGCALFYPWMGNTFNISYEGGSRTVYTGTYASYTGVTTTSVNGCQTTSTTPYTIGIGGTKVAGTTSTKTTVATTTTDITVTTNNYSDTACTTQRDTLGFAPPYVGGEDVAKYSLTLTNAESKKLRTTTSVAPTSTSPATYTETIGTTPLPVQELTLLLTSHTIKCATAACATADQAYYQALMDTSVSPAVAIASCKTVTFTAGTATDVSACEKDQAAMNKKVFNQTSMWADPIPAEVYFDGAKNRLYYSLVELSLPSVNNYIAGDSFYQK